MSELDKLQLEIMRSVLQTQKHKEQQAQIELQQAELIYQHVCQNLAELARKNKR